jgi:hypothetical protein
MLHADAGGYAPFIDSGMVERGEVDVLEYSKSDTPLSDLDKVSQGYWRRWRVDKQLYYNYVDGAVPHFQKDIKNLGGAPDTSQGCKTTVEEWKQIPALMIDGITGIADILKYHLSDRPESAAFKESYKVTEEEYTTLGLTQGHYGIVQKELAMKWSRGFSVLPTKWLLVTALESRGETKEKETIYGPQSAGTAQTHAIPSWFNHCFHLDTVTYQDVKTPLANPNGTGVQKTGIVAWFVKHPDSVTGVPCLAVTKVMPEIYQALMQCFPYGFVPLDYNNGLVRFFEVVEILKAKYLERITKK